MTRTLKRIVSIILIMSILLALFGCGESGSTEDVDAGSSVTESSSGNVAESVIEVDEIKVTFFNLYDTYYSKVYANTTYSELRLKSTTGRSPGDCALIQIGDVDILIDGGYASSVNSLLPKLFGYDVEYSKTYIEGLEGSVSVSIDALISDNVLEYLIVTHGDADHISGLVGSFTISESEDAEDDPNIEATSYYNSTSPPGILDVFTTNVSLNGNVYKQCTVETIIDFNSAFVSGNNLCRSESSKESTKVYTGYVEKIDAIKELGCNYYAAADFFYNDNPDFNDGTLKQEGGNVFDLGSGAKLEILYNEYYYKFSSTSDGSAPSYYSNVDKNNISVAFLITFGESKILFTGDMMEEAEVALVKYYEENEPGKLSNITLFKAGHHGNGSETKSSVRHDASNTATLLNAITPSVVVATCVLDAPSKTAAAIDKEFLDRLPKANSSAMLLCPSIYNEETGSAEAFYGDITVTIDKYGNYDVDITNTSNEDVYINNKVISLFDTEWYAAFVASNEEDN